MGYEPAPCQTTADFLVSVTDPNGRRPMPDIGGRSLSRLPRTASDFEAYFKASDAGWENREDMEAYKSEFMGRPDRARAYEQSAVAEQSKHVWKQSPHLVSIPMQVRAIMVRRIQILRGDFTALAIMVG